jgi:hypothetical protein
MPVIPAWVVRANLDDPRKIPYLLVWKDEKHGGEIKEAVRLTHCVGALEGYVELKGTNGSATVLCITWRMLLPRNGGRALFLLCPHCDTPRRHVYGWEWDSFSGWSNRVRRTDWCRRSCNRLRYGLDIWAQSGEYFIPRGPNTKNTIVQLIRRRTSGVIAPSQPIRSDDRCCKKRAWPHRSPVRRKTMSITDRALV